MNKQRRDELGKIQEARRASDAMETAIDTIETPAVKVAREVLTKECKQCGARNMTYKRLCFKCFCPSFHELTEKEDD